MAFRRCMCLIACAVSRVFLKCTRRSTPRALHAERENPFHVKIPISPFLSSLDISLLLFLRIHWSHSDVICTTYIWPRFPARWNILSSLKIPVEKYREQTLVTFKFTATGSTHDKDGSRFPLPTLPHGAYPTLQATGESSKYACA